MFDRFRFVFTTGVASVAMLAASYFPAHADTNTVAELQYDSATHCGIVLASRQTIPEVTELLRSNEIIPVPTMQLYLSENGWYALLWDAVPIDQSEATIATLKADGRIPEDAFCSSGRSFTRYIDQAEYFPEGALAELSAAHADDTKSGNVLQFDPATECGLVVSSHDSLDKVSTYLHEEYAAEKTMQLYRSENGWYAIILGVIPDTLADKALAMGKAEGLLMEDSFCTKGSKYVEFIPQADYFPASARHLIPSLTPPEAENSTSESVAIVDAETSVETQTETVATQPRLLPLTNPEPIKAVIAWARGLGLPESIIPATPEALFAVEYLDLQDLQIETLPTEIGQLANLNQLNLFGNQLTALPESIGDLPNLTILDVGNNALIGLPEQIGQLTALKRLNLSDNQLIALPLSIDQLSQLQYLALANNELWEIPGTLQSLTELRGLYVAGNPIKQVPEWINTMPQLIDFIQ